jgi:hypothetical protein
MLETPKVFGTYLGNNPKDKTMDNQQETVLQKVYYQKYFSILEAGSSETRRKIPFLSFRVMI